MNCPFCSTQETKVLDSRPDPTGRSIRRRRECLGCQKKWRTLERVEDKMPIVVKKNNTHQPFNREKLYSSISVSCGKRPVTTSQMESAVANIEWAIMESGVDSISSIKIGEMVMKALKELDDIAYVRFASVYRRFKDVSELMSEVQKLVNQEVEKKFQNKDQP